LFTFDATGRRMLVSLLIITMLAAATAADGEVARFPAPEANQGAVADARFFYAIGNNVIGKYDRRSGRRVASWIGDTARFPHINSCTPYRGRLYCASSNYPAVPMASAVEVFDTRRMAHVASHPLPPLPGSITWIAPRGRGGWWAGFANYDGRGGAPGRDHRATFLARLDDRFAPTASWLLPDAVLARMAPYSMSGGAVGPDGLIYVTGHDRRELYALCLPTAGTRLELVAMHATATGGQAIGWDPAEPGLLWSIERKTREVVASRPMPPTGRGELPPGCRSALSR
jgi:hypothetical protein